MYCDEEILGFEVSWAGFADLSFDLLDLDDLRAEEGTTMAQAMTLSTLVGQNRQFAGTKGISQENRARGFVPGFLDQETGCIYIACWANGSPAPFHLLDGLPEDLVLARSATGQVVAVKATIIAGFIRDGCFYTRQQAARWGNAS